MYCVYFNLNYIVVFEHNYIKKEILFTSTHDYNILKIVNLAGNGSL